MHLPGEGEGGQSGCRVWQGRGEEVVRQAGPGWEGLADSVRSVSLILTHSAMRWHCEVIPGGEGHDLSYICNV